MTAQRPRRRARAGACQPVQDQVETLLASIAERGSARRAASAAASSASFRATVEQRLKSLEAELGEVKNRINGLLFLAAGAVLTQLALHLLHW